MKARQQFAALAAAVMVGLAAAGATADRIDIPTGFPDETTTGIAGVGLTLGDLTPSGGMTITTDGMVIENMYITGGLNIKANNVTVRNTYIDAGTPPAGPFYGINASFGYTGTLIEDVTVIGGRSKSVYGGNMTVRRVNLSGGLDTLHVQSNVLVEDSYLHDLFQLPGSHNDGIQSTGGSNVTIRGNTIQALYQQQTSAIIIQSNFSPVDNVLIENNFLSGGTYTVYVRDKGNGHGVPTNVVIRDNVWEHEGWKFGLISADGGDHITYTGNTFHTGALIPQNADEGDGEDPPYESPDLPPADGPVTSSSAFQSFGIGTQTAPFTLTFDATPHNDNMNGVVGVLRGEAEDWSDIASLLRFFTNGQIEVRDGGDYGNDVALAYSAGTSYFVRLVIDPTDQSYSAFVTPEGGEEIALAQDYAFRLDQADVDLLDHWALRHVEGSFTVDNVQVVPEPGSVALLAAGLGLVAGRRRRV